MTSYLDASVLVALLVRDPFTSRIYGYLNATMPRLAISDFAGAEFASAVARRVRMAELTVRAARQAFVVFDGLVPRAAELVETLTIDIKTADGFVRRLDLPLRAPDALNIAIAQRIGATLITFDEKMAASAKALGIDVAAA